MGEQLDVDVWLEELRRRKWTVHVFGPKDAPRVVAAVFEWESCADVVILRGEDDASAYRVPLAPGVDLFLPALVSWQYHAPASWTLRAVLTIEPPGHPRAPMAVQLPAPLCAVPAEIRHRPVTIRLPAVPSGASRCNSP